MNFIKILCVSWVLCLLTLAERRVGCLLWVEEEVEKKVESKDGGIRWQWWSEPRQTEAHGGADKE